MRDRAYRRHMEEIKVLKRLRKTDNWFYYKFEDINGLEYSKPMLKDYIGTYLNFQYKTLTTNINDSKCKKKYSPNKSFAYQRNSNKKGTRERNKIEFKKELQQLGLKHFNT